MWISKTRFERDVVVFSRKPLDDGGERPALKAAKWLSRPSILVCSRFLDNERTVYHPLELRYLTDTLRWWHGLQSLFVLKHWQKGLSSKLVSPPKQPAPLQRPHEPSYSSFGSKRHVPIGIIAIAKTHGQSSSSNTTDLVHTLAAPTAPKEKRG